MTSDALAEVPPRDSESRRSSILAESQTADSVSVSEPVTSLTSSEMSDTGQRWLNWQCQMIAGNLQGRLFSLQQSSVLSTIAQWPEQCPQESRLNELCIQAVEASSPRILPFQPQGSESGRACDLIAVPLFSDNQIFCVVGLILTPRSETQRNAVVQLLQWGGIWLESLDGSESLENPLSNSYLPQLIKSTSLNEMASDLVRLLAERFACESVSLGLCDGGSIRELAATDAGNDQLKNLMLEATDQQQSIVYPAPESDAGLISFAHQLRYRESGLALCTVPLQDQQRSVAVLVLEREAEFSTSESAAIKDLCQGIPALMALLKQREQSVLSSVAGQVSGWIGGRKRGWLIAALLVFVLSMFINIEYRVSAPASIEAAERQLLVAPHDGYIRQVEARVGDRVVKGQTLLFMEDRELQLQKQKWAGEKTKLEREYQEALARSERTRLSILRARIDQVNAEISLVEDNIQRSNLKAPIDGVLISGDKSHSLGAAVTIGEPLFEVAPMGSYRVVLEVSEHRMAEMDAGRSGSLIFTAVPDRPLAFTIERIMPAAQASEQGSYFRVEALLDQQSLADMPVELRPGMQGLAKVDMGERSVLWILTHRLLERIGLWFWSLGG